MTGADPRSILQALALESRSNPRAALARCEAMLERAPGLVPILCLAGRLCRELNDPRRARAHLEQALQLNPRTPAALLELGLLELATGRPVRATRLLEQYVADNPERPQGWYRLGAAREAAGAWAGAADAYGRALRLSVADPDAVRIQRGGVLARAGRLDEAAEDFRAVLDEDPDRLEAHLGLGMVATAAGRADDAEAAFRAALALEPGLALAHQQLIALRPVERPDDPDLLALKALAESADGSSENREHAGYGLAKGLLDLGRDEAAFAAARQANALREARLGAFDVAAWRARVEQIRQAFVDDPATAAPATGPGPVFLLTAPRSGATLLERMLCAHPALDSRGEDPILEQAMAAEAPGWPDRLPGEQARQALRGAYAEGGMASVNKYPGNARMAGLLRWAFPEARFIWLDRDPRDVGLSIYLQDFPDAARFTTNLASIRAYLDGQRALCALWQRCFPEAVHRLDYETLVTDPEPSLRAALEFLGLPWNEACLQPEAGGAAIGTLSRWQAREPVHAGSVGRWRRFADWLGPLGGDDPGTDPTESQGP